jgi:hypothetical protein
MRATVAGPPEGRTRDRFLSADQGKRRDGHGREHGPDKMQAALGCERTDDRVPVERGIGRDQDEVQRAGQFLQLG